MTAEADLGEGAVTMDALVIGWSFRSDNTEYTHIQFDNTDDKIGTTGASERREARGERAQCGPHLVLLSGHGVGAARSAVSCQFIAFFGAPPRGQPNVTDVCATCPSCNHARAMASGVVPCPADAPLRVACVGDSLTRGDGLHEHPPSNRVPTSRLHPRHLPMRQRGSYPALLSRLLSGANYLNIPMSADVRNFGHGGSTACATSGTRGPAYADTPEFRAALRFKPHIVLLMLGTNDAKRHLWRGPCGESAYREGLASIARAFMTATSPPNLLVLLSPPPMNADIVFDIDTTLLQQVRHGVALVAAALAADTAAARTRVRLAPPLPIAPTAATIFTYDQLHLNANGSALLACAVHEAVRWDLPRGCSRQRAGGSNNGWATASRSCWDPFCLPVGSAPAVGSYVGGDFSDDGERRGCEEESGIGAAYALTGMACKHAHTRELARATCQRLRAEHGISTDAVGGGASAVASSAATKVAGPAEMAEVAAKAAATAAATMAATAAATAAGGDVMDRFRAIQSSGGWRFRSGARRGKQHGGGNRHNGFGGAAVRQGRGGGRAASLAAREAAFDSAPVGTSSERMRIVLGLMNQSDSAGDGPSPAGVVPRSALGAAAANGQKLRLLGVAALAALMVAVMGSRRARRYCERAPSLIP